MTWLDFAVPVSSVCGSKSEQIQPPNYLQSLQEGCLSVVGRRGCLLPQCQTMVGPSEEQTPPGIATRFDPVPAVHSASSNNETFYKCLVYVLYLQRGRRQHTGAHPLVTTNIHSPNRTIGKKHNVWFVWLKGASSIWPATVLLLLSE